MPRRDDDFLDIPPLVPDNETLNARKPAPRPATPSRSPNSSAPSLSANRAGTFALIIAVVGLASTAGYFHYQLTRQGVVNDALQKRIGVLEAQLGLSKTSDGEFGETLDVKVKGLDERIKTADSEIRKLWAIANDRNKKAIENHDKLITSQGKSLESLQGTVGEMKKSLAQAEKSAIEASRAAAEVRQAIADSSKSLGEMRISVGALQQRIAQGDPQSREAVQQAALALDQTEQVQAKLETLNQRIAAHEESLRSIDIFRRSVNSDLNKLKQQSLGGQAVPYGQ